LFSLTYIPQAVGVVDTYFQSQVLSRNSVIVQVIAALLATAFKLGCLLLGAGLSWFLAAYVLEAFITGVGLLIAFRNRGNRLRGWRFSSTIARQLLADSWPLMLSSLAIGLYTKLDQVMINHLLGTEQVGIYAVAAKLSEVWYVIPMVICASVSPAIIRAAKTSDALLEFQLKKLYILMLASSVSIAVTLTAFAHFIIRLLFGAPFEGAAASLQIYAWSGVAVFLGVAFSQYLLAKNLTKVSFHATMLGALSNVILNVALIPRYGITGAAIATLFSYTVSTFGIFLNGTVRRHGQSVMRSLFV
jgi:O-antigen/teichoic acid export membrane protein